MNRLRFVIACIIVILMSCQKSEDKTSDGYDGCRKEGEREASEEMISQHKNLQEAYSKYSKRYNDINLEVEDMLEKDIWYIVESKSDWFQFFEIIYDFKILKKLEFSVSDAITGCPVSDSTYIQSYLKENEKKDLFTEIRERSMQDSSYRICRYRIVLSDRTESLYECPNRAEPTSN